MQLLSASEKSALQSFLSVMDYPDDTLTASEWALLSSGTPLSNASSDNAFFVEEQHKEALAKATKDLMSLEPDRWRSQSALLNAVDGRADHNHQHHQHLRGFQQQQASMQHFQHFQQRRPMLGSSFSFPQAKSPMHYPGQHPSLAMNGAEGPSSIQTSSTGMVHQLIDPSYDGLLGTPMGQSQSASSSSSRHALQPPSSSSSSVTTASSSSQRHSSLKRKRKSTSPSSSATPSTTPTPKQTLLSPSQKKANHIQSEQKRRANIRRGYEALCEAVPALREAIRQEEEEAAMMAEKNSTSGAGRRRRKKGSGQGKNGAAEEKDRIDGRAGPRSENVVLTKSGFKIFAA